MKSGVGLVLFSHGSLLCGSGQILNQHAQRLRKAGKYVAVEPGYLNYCDPPVEEAIKSCLDAGANEIIIVPYFLVAGKFVKEDLPKRLETATKQFPGTQFRVARAIEDIDLMRTAIEQLLPDARDPRAWQVTAIANARLKCELRTDCPLYGSPACMAEEGHA